MTQEPGRTGGKAGRTEIWGKEIPYQQTRKCFEMDMSLGSRGQSRCRERPAREVAGAEPGDWAGSSPGPTAQRREPGCSHAGPTKLREAAGQVSAGNGHDGIPAAKKAAEREKQEEGFRSECNSH